MFQVAEVDVSALFFCGKIPAFELRHNFHQFVGVHSGLYVLLPQLVNAHSAEQFLVLFRHVVVGFKQRVEVRANLLFDGFVDFYKVCRRFFAASCRRKSDKPFYAHVIHRALQVVGFHFAAQIGVGQAYFRKGGKSFVVATLCQLCKVVFYVYAGCRYVAKQRFYQRIVVGILNKVLSLRQIPLFEVFQSACEFIQ